MWRLILRELRDKRWSLLAYCLGSLALIWIYVATFRSTQSSASQLQALVKGYPKGLVDALGLDTFSLNTIESYLNAKHFSLLWPLLAVILATARAGGQFAGEVETGTMGLLLSLPLTRLQIWWSKYASGLVTILCFTTVSVWGIVPLAGAYNITSHVDVLLAAWILTTMFMWMVYAVGLAVSTVVSDKGPAYAATSSIFLLSYVAYIVSLINDDLAKLKYISVFHYFNTQHVLSTGKLTGSSLVLFGLIIIVASLFSTWRFNSRDISV